MAFSNQYGGVPHISPQSTGALMMMDALNDSSKNQPKNVFSLLGDLGKVGGQLWQDYNDNDARQAMMQYTDSKDLQDAIASGKLDLSETSTKFQKEAAEHIKNLADTKLSQVTADKNQFEYDKEKRLEDAMQEASPIINEMNRLMSTGNPADFQKAMEMSLQIKDPRVLKEIGLNPREEYRSQRKLDLEQQRVGIEAGKANIEARRLNLELQKEELAQYMDLAKKYEAAGITPKTAQGAAILKNALGPYFKLAYPMAYSEGGEAAAKNIGTASSSASEIAQKALDLSDQKLEALATSNEYTKAFSSLTDDAKAELDKDIKGEDMIGLSKTIINSSLGIEKNDMKQGEVAEFSDIVQKVYREEKRANPNITLKDVAAVLLGNRAAKRNVDKFGGSLRDVGLGNYFDFKDSGWEGVGFVFDEQAFREELRKSAQSNNLSNQIDSLRKELAAEKSNLDSINIRANQEMAIAGHSGHGNAKREAELAQEYQKCQQNINKIKAKIEAKLEQLSGRRL